MIAIQVAKYLQGQGLVTYDEDSPDGDCYIATVPSRPDAVVVLTPYPGAEASVKHGYDTPHVQVRVRGGEDPKPPHDRALAIYDVLHGLGPFEFDDGTQLISCIGIQSAPAYIGRDENGRHEYTQNFRLEIRAHTAHRE